MENHPGNESVRNPARLPGLRPAHDGEALWPDHQCWIAFFVCGASKSAVASLTKTLAIEWATSGVCVNALVPGVLRTDLNAALLDGTERGREFLMRTPMRRFGKIEELAGAAVFLASDAASFVTGHLLVVDGGILASGVNQ